MRLLLLTLLAVSNAGAQDGVPKERLGRVDGFLVVRPLVENVRELWADELSAEGRADLEATVTRLLSLPEGFGFALGRAADRVAARNESVTAQDGTLMLLGRVTHPDFQDGGLKCNVTTDLDWFVVGSLLCISDTPSSAFSREQAASRRYFRPMALVPTMVSVLETLRALRARNLDLVWFNFGQGGTTGARPFVRVHVGFSLAGDSEAQLDYDQRASSAHQVHGILPLPAAAARTPGSAAEEARRRGAADSVIGPVRTTRNVVETVDRLLMLYAELQCLPGDVRLVHNPGDDSVHIIANWQATGTRTATLLARTTLPSKPFSDADARVNLAGVELGVDELNEVLREVSAVARAHDEEFAFLAAFAANEEQGDLLLAVTTPSGEHPSDAKTAHVLELDFSAAQPFTKLVAGEPRECRPSGGPADPVLTVLLDGGRRLVLRRKFAFCGVGFQWPPVAEIDRRGGHIVGGTTFDAGHRPR